MTKIKKRICWIAVLVIAVGGILLLPLERENVVLAFSLENVSDGTELDICIENSAGAISEETVHVYGGTTELWLNPDDYECESITIRGMADEETAVSVQLYSGSYDTSQDKMLSEIRLDQSASDGTLILGESVCESISRALKNNWGLKGRLILLFLAIYVLVALYRRPEKLKYAKLFLWLFLGVYIVCGIVGDRFELLEKYTTVPNTGETVQSHTISGTVETEFSVTSDDMDSITIPVVTDAETVYEDFGVRIVRTGDGEEIYSRLFTADFIKRNDGFVLSFSDMEEPLAQGDYVLILEPLDADVDSTVQFQFDESDTLGISVRYGPSSRNQIFLIGCLIGIFLLLLLTFCYRDFRLSDHMAVKITYCGVLLYAVVQVIFYGMYVGNTPDEVYHLSYVAYLLESRTLIPDFPNMPIYPMPDWIPIAEEGSINYLGHPPLYYWILTLVQMAAGGEMIHVNLLRFVSACMGLSGVCIFFALGNRYISGKYPWVHLVYAASCISVPFITYSLCGVNNDALSFLGVAVAFWGVLRFEKKNRNSLTFLLLACGMFLTIFSKLTAGLVLLVAYLVYLAYVCLREKSLRCVFNRACLVVIPFVLVVATYFGILYMRYGTIQPALGNMNYAYYMESAFYTDFSERSVLTLSEYFSYYWTNFLTTWSDIISHVSINKPSKWYGWDRCIYLVLLVCPVFAVRKKFAGRVFCLGVFAGMLFTMLMQFYNAYKNFYFTAGYMGGYQSRYYLCWVPILAFVFAHLFLAAEEDGTAEYSVKKQRIRVLSVVCVLLLFYGSFLYTLLTYTK
ncbi:MAG: glycosyltransferase family 39 protein [Clostridiales bacterium]|nr:glycosyltransferase family 39 protein [Clostridiales bacterium]